MRLFYFDNTDPAHSPFERGTLLHRVGPFFVIYVLALVSLFALQRPLHDPAYAWGAVALVAAAGLLAVLLPWHRLPRVADLIPPLGMMLATGLIRHADGGTSSGVGVLGILPIVWLALYGPAWHLGVGIAALALMLAAPVLVVGPPLYHVEDLLRAELWALAAALLGVAIHQLVSEARAHARQWQRQARTDALTGLPNRPAVEEALKREMSRSRRSGQPLSIAFLDLDRFKAFNDSYGHHAGDALLAGAAAAWTGQLRGVDLIGRVGGEEFVVVFPGIVAEQAAAVVERLRPVTPQQQTFSAGVAQLGSEDTALSLLARADERLYEAKRRGRNQTVTAEGTFATPQTRRIPLAQVAPLRPGIPLVPFERP